MASVGDDSDGFVVKLRGLPWSAKEEDIKRFFAGCESGIRNICFTYTREGRASGQAFVEFESAADVDAALLKHKEYLDSRYIEVFKCKKSEMDYQLRRSGRDGSDDAVVRMRGLPFGCALDEVTEFFNGLDIAPNGLTIVYDYTGMQTGEAFVQFTEKRFVDRALEKHMQEIGHRYIEVFRSSVVEMNNSRVSHHMDAYPYGAVPFRPNPFIGAPRGRAHFPFPGTIYAPNAFRGAGRGPFLYNGPGNMAVYRGDSRFYLDDYTSYADYMGFGSYGNARGSYFSPRATPRGAGSGGTARRKSGNSNKHVVRLRGLPFDAKKEDIIQFFSPLDVTNLRLKFDRLGRANGSAEVEFKSHNEAVEAMKKDREKIGHRYIELFLESTAAEKLLPATDGVAQVAVAENEVEKVADAVTELVLDDAKVEDNSNKN